MNNINYIEFIRTSTPGPYGIPLKVVDNNESEILFEIEIDDTIHSFSIKREDVISGIVSPDQRDLMFVEIGVESMSKLYGKISAVIKSEKNQFML